MYTDFVKNVTISLDEDLLARSREKARDQGVSFNQWVRDLISREAQADRRAELQRFYDLADSLNIRLEGGKPYTREEAHERR